jgi:hypothetical protein
MAGHRGGPGPGGGQAGGGAFADEIAFELGQDGEHMKDELAARGGGVDRLLEAAEPDATLGQAGDGVDQMPQRPAEVVESPDDEGVAGRSWSSTWTRVGRSVRAPLAVSGWLCDVDFGPELWTRAGRLVAREWWLSQKRSILRHRLGILR